MRSLLCDTTDKKDEEEDQSERPCRKASQLLFAHILQSTLVELSIQLNFMRTLYLALKQKFVYRNRSTLQTMYLQFYVY